MYRAQKGLKCVIYWIKSINQVFKSIQAEIGRLLVFDRGRLRGFTYRLEREPKEIIINYMKQYNKKSFNNN